MIKLYRKNELMFAIGCIVVYVVVCGNLRAPGDDNPYMTLGLLVMAALLFLFVKKNELMEEYGLSAWAKNSKQMLYFLPLWLITTGNLWGGIVPKYQGLGLLCAVVSFALVGFLEELIFRGFLFRAMLRDGSKTSAIIISSVTFGIGHIVNLLTGHAAPETIVQVFWAIAMGFLFTMVYYKSGSLLPGILAHSLIDVFSVFSGRSDTVTWIFIGVTIAVAVGYGFYLRAQETPAINRIARTEK
ncbi:MAG: CPBP family intramembrane metalloprotease [Oscillospiraceae bacterium]|nr:CPBP family intramembrane metalloprotease [Oscillospiraceae bacterium]MBQ1805565.1 CPBP family intramembrane metalloprotease [Oscillospiraceae bacterium]